MGSGNSSPKEPEEARNEDSKDPVAANQPTETSVLISQGTNQSSEDTESVQNPQSLKVREKVKELLGKPDGDKEIEKHLDLQVDTSESTATILFDSILETEGSPGSRQQMRVVKELIDLRASVWPSTQWGEAKKAGCMKLLSHPVLATFIHLKWEKTRWLFYLSTIGFLLFSAIFAVFVDRIHWHKQCRLNNDCVARHGDDDLQWELPIFAGLLSMSVLLIGSEICQFIVLRFQYLEMEKLVKWISTIGSTVATILIRETTDDKTLELAHGIAAVSICAAGIEMTFLISQHPFRGVSFAILYYTKKVLSCVILLAPLVVGSAFAFPVLTFSIKDSSVEMVEASGSASTGGAFDILFLFLLLVFANLAMLALLLAVNISNVSKEMRRKANHETLINMANVSILAEALPYRLASWFLVGCLFHSMFFPYQVHIKLQEKLSNTNKKILDKCY